MTPAHLFTLTPARWPRLRLLWSALCSPGRGSGWITALTVLALSLIGVTVYVGSLRQDEIQREAEQRIVGQSIQALGQGIGNTGL